LETGQSVTVLACSFGNITPLICIDLFNAEVKDVLSHSHGNLFAVPSLSPKTSAHQTAANDLQARNLASTFVCNHWNEESPSHRSTSFYQVPVKDGRQFHVRRDASKLDRPYALFDLRKISK
jgi:predicted amidohydrolase